MFVQTKVDILARLIGAAIDGADRETRYYLNGVHVRRSPVAAGVICEATNGHILALEHDFAGSCSENNAHSLVIPRDTVAAIVREAKVNAKNLTVNWRDQVVRVTSTGFSFADTAVFPAKGFIDCSFPECQRVIPQIKRANEPGFAGQMNARLVWQLLETAGAQEIERDRKAFPYQLFADRKSDSPVVAAVPGRPNWLGVIMPMRQAADLPDPRPTWLFPPAPKAVAAE
jgi:hypothetical protein